MTTFKPFNMILNFYLIVQVCGDIIIMISITNYKIMFSLFKGHQKIKERCWYGYEKW